MKAGGCLPDRYSLPEEGEPEAGVPPAGGRGSWFRVPGSGFEQGGGEERPEAGMGRKGADTALQGTSEIGRCTTSEAFGIMDLGAKVTGDAGPAAGREPPPRSLKVRYNGARESGNRL